MANVALCMLFILYSVVTASDLTATQAKVLYCLSGFIAKFVIWCLVWKNEPKYVCVWLSLVHLCISVTERGWGMSRVLTGCPREIKANVEPETAWERTAWSEPGLILVSRALKEWRAAESVGAPTWILNMLSTAKSALRPSLARLFAASATKRSLHTLPDLPYAYNVGVSSYMSAEDASEA